MNLIARIINVFVAPSKTFQAVSHKPKWAWPLIISLLLTFAAMWVLTPVVITDSKSTMEEKMLERGMSQDQVDNAVAQAAKYQKYSIAPTTFVAGLIMTFILAGIWLFVGNTVLGGSAKFAQMMGVIVYSGFIGLLGLLIKMPIMLSQQTMNVHFSLATFMADASKDTFLYKLLANVEIFNIWTIAVYAIGIAIVAKLKVKSVWPWVLILTVLYWAAAAGLGSAFGR
ncbi:hypothetical protein DRI50_09270 [candidate division KSB1 bacterium]|nr:MAG: hypothetical protein DRI50_09270 [candidate division KSB1 bacterium]